MKEPEAGRCGAKKRNGQPCRKWPVKGRNRCRLHGGATPTGQDHPGYKHGRWSRDLPARLAARFADFIDDGDPHDMQGEIALVDLGIGELVAKIDTGESAAAWDRAGKIYANMIEAANSGDQAAFQGRMILLGDALREGAEQYEIWGDIRAQIEQKRRVVDSNRKAEKDRAETLDRRAQVALMGAISSAIQECFTSDEEKVQFAKRLRHILNSGG